MDILGIRIDNYSMDEALEKTLSAIKNKDSFKYIFTPNAEIAMAALKDEKLLQVLNSSFINIADGDGVVLASKIIKTPLKGKVAGCDFVQNLLADGQAFSVYFLGATEESVTEAIRKIENNHDHITISGYRNGFFNEKDHNDILEDIRNKNPDLIIIGLGAPKQEFFIYENRDLFPNSIAIGAGGTIDIISGQAKRAPDFFCKYKLEWLYRLIKQPKRFVRMLNIPLFLSKAFIFSIKNKKKD